MQFFKPITQEETALVGFGLAVMMVAPPGAAATEQKTGRLAGLGCTITLEPDVAGAISALCEGGQDLVVIDAEAVGGLYTAQSIVSLMRRGGADMPAIIVSQGLHQQTFPEDPAEPVILRAPLSAVGLRVAIEFALRSGQSQLAA